MTHNPVRIKPTTTSTQDVKDSTSTSGILKGEKGSREVHTEAKPKGTLTFKDAPFKFFTTAFSQFFSRFADRFHDDNTQIYRRAERALQDPFAPPAEKRAAVDALVKLDDKAFLAISFNKKNGRNEDSILRSLSEALAKNPENKHLQEAGASYIRKLYASYGEVLPVYSSDRADHYKANKEIISKILSNPNLPDDTKLNLLNIHLDFSVSKAGQELGERFFGAAFLESQPLQRSFVLVRLYDTLNKISNRTDQRELGKVIDALEELPNKEAVNLARDMIVHSSPNLENLNRLFAIALQGDSEAARAENFETLMNARYEIQRGPQASAATRSLRSSILHNDDNSPTAEKTALAEIILKAGKIALSVDRSLDLLGTDALSKESSLALAKDICKGLRNKDNSVKASQQQLQRLVDAYVRFSPQLTEEERVDFLKTTLMPLLSHKSVGIDKLRSLGAHTPGKALLAQDLSKIAGSMSNAEAPKLLKSISILLSSATHQRDKRILSHQADFLVQHAIMNNSNLKADVRTAAAKEAEEQLAQIHREATVPDSFGKYTEGTAKRIEQDSKAFVDDGSYERYDAEIVAFLKPKSVERVKFEGASIPLDELDKE